MKHLLFTLCLLTTNALAGGGGNNGRTLSTPIERTIFSSLEAGKSKSYDLTIPKGKTSVSVTQTDDSTDAVLTCTFSSDGVIGLEQKKVSQCLGKLDLAKENKVTLKVTNESKKTLDFQVKQFPVK